MANSGRILVVDDNRINRMQLKRVLEQQGHTVALAENGRQALEVIRQAPFDLLLLDIIMPELDGYQVLERLKQDPDLREIPVIVISALDEMDSVIKCIGLGAEDYLPKPFNPLLLRARLGACLEKKQLRDQELEYLHQVARLTDAASAVEAGTFDLENLTPVAERTDALGHLARVFLNMAREVYAREQRLKQQLMELRIEIDEVKKAREVEEIVDSDYFRELRVKAAQLREKREEPHSGPS
ncbi:MAG: response regulator [Anaerolineae bacterium]